MDFIVPPCVYEGHTSRDCPNKRGGFSGVRCNKCRRASDEITRCNYFKGNQKRLKWSWKRPRAPKQEVKWRVSPLRWADKGCWTWGQIDHFSANCTQSKCWYCGKPGHEKSRCHNRQIEIRPAFAILANKKCLTSGHVGHFSANCILTKC